MRYPRPKAILQAHFSRFFFALILVFNVFFCVSYAPAEEAFPVYQVIRPNVVFWKKIYGHYHSRQAILHDRNNLNIIYTVVELVSWEVPGSARINQKMIKLARSRIKNILYELGHGKPPTSREEKRIAALFPKKRHTTYLKARDNIRLQIGQKDRFQEGVIGSGRYLGRIKKIFRQYGLPGELAYIPHVESSFTTHARSKAGATGLWQFTSSTGKEFLTINEYIDERLDPFASTHAAARLLRENYAQLGNWPLAITAYNYGRAGMVRAMKEYKTYPDIFTHYKKGHFKFASRNFYSEFLAAHRVANRLEQNPKIIKDRPEATVTFRLQGDASSITLRKFFQISKKDFARLNPALKHPLLDGTSPIPAGYPVELPATKRIRLKKKQWKESMYVSGEHDGKTYAVKKGDSLSTIAKKHKTTVKQLQALNDLDSAGLIQVNQKLLLPSSGNIIILKNNPKRRPY